MVLLDTHAIMWIAANAPQLGSQASVLALRAVADERLAASAFSFWELALLAKKGRLNLGRPANAFRQFVLDQGIREIPLTGAIGIAAVELPDLHADPADRIIVATALAYDATLITADERILNWNGPLETHDART